MLNKQNREKKIGAIIFKPIQEFLSFDSTIKNYMAMHWVGGFLLIYSTLLPAFMNKLHINIINVGVIISVATLLDVVFTYILSKYLDKISPNVGMAVDWWTESIPPLIYSFASSIFHFFLGIFATGVTNILNPIYQVYENEIFPEDQRSLIYTYHLMTPEFFSLIFYPIIGYLLTYVFPSVEALRVVFAICGIAYFGVGFIPIKKLKWVKPTVFSNQKISVQIPKELYLIGFAQILVFLGLGFTSTLITSYYILDKMNGTIMAIIMLEVIESVITIVTGLCTKDLGKIISEEKLAQYGVAFFMIFALLMIFSKNYYLVLLAYIFRAIGSTIWFPYHNSLLMQYVPKEKRGRFFGSISSLNKLLNIIVPLISGFLAGTFGFFVPFTLTFLSFLSVCVVYQIIFAKRDKIHFEISKM